MPIQPKPWSVRCPKCGWNKSHQPLSDALVAGDVPPERCPRCGHEPLEFSTPPHNAAAGLHDALNTLGSLFKPK